MKEKKNFDLKGTVFKMLASSAIGGTFLFLILILLVDIQYLPGFIYFSIASVIYLLLWKYDKEYKYSSFLVPFMTLLLGCLPIAVASDITLALVFATIGILALMVSTVFENSKSTAIIGIIFSLIFIINLILKNLFNFSFITSAILTLSPLESLFIGIIMNVVILLNILIN